VVTYPSPSSTQRNVDLAWVEDWDDASQLFLITFGDEQPAPPLSLAIEEDTPFESTAAAGDRKAFVPVRQGQHRFKFRVFRRYGAQCAVCDVSVEKLLDAAHIRTHRERGSDDPRNGLVLCALHHRAFDNGFFAINPATLRIAYRNASAADLRITRESLNHLGRRPHESVLEWRWKHWAERSGGRVPT
jgi:putative restriction endonuclease